MPLLTRNQKVTAEVKDPSGSIAIMRFNHLQPPFDNPAVRRALLGAVDQADVMSAVAGTDHAYWRDRIGLFGPSSPLANEAGIEAMSGPRDYDKVKRDLTAAGYRGEPIVVLAVSGISYLVYISQVGADQLRKAGMNVDLQTMDVATMMRRRTSKEPPEKGGWNVYFTILDGLFNANPATNTAIRGDGKSGRQVGHTARNWRHCVTNGSMRLTRMGRSGSLRRCSYRCGRTYRISRWGIGSGPPHIDATSLIYRGALPPFMGYVECDQACRAIEDGLITPPRPISPARGTSRVARFVVRLAVPPRADQKSGGGVKPPNSRSISPANAIVVRSSR